MKRAELLLGAIIYSIIIAVGYSGSVLKKLENLHWNNPAVSLTWTHFLYSDPLPNPGVKKPLLTSRVRQILTLYHPVSGPALVQDSSRQDLEEKWKKMGAHPSGLNPGIESIPKAFEPLRQKARLIATPQNRERKVPDGQEASKG